MTIEGVDYSFARPGGAALAAAGKRFAVRYVPYGGVGKGLTKDELADLRANGLAVALVFESTAGRMLYGKDAGIEDAKTSAQAVARLGFPLTTPVYFACDFNATTVHQSSIDAYLRGAASIIGAERVGIYGGYNVIQRCAASRTAQWFWQTYAWSAGKLSAHAHLYQYLNGQVINGGKVDLCRALQAEYGQWDAPPQSSPQDPADVSLPVSSEVPALVDLVKDKQLYDLGGKPLTLVSGAATNVRSPYEVEQGANRHLRVVAITTAGVRQLALIANADANVRPIPPPVIDCSQAVAAEHERTLQEAKDALEAIP